MDCAGLTLTEDGGAAVAAVIAPKGVRSLWQNPRTAPFLQP